ncbi:DUF58 domain-containing protein [Pedobacter psychrophilus]|nr:DUF58 domain-containing protein [Pedobacter psychrophilus]
MGVVVFLFILSFIFSSFSDLPYFAFGILISILLLDTFILFRKNNINAERILGPRLSNGDDNPVYIWVQNNYPFAVSVNVLDELPIQFQIRDFSYKLNLKPLEKQNLDYYIKPVKRGIYAFGDLRIFVSSAIKLVERRYSFNAEKEVAVYPSYLQMRRYELMAISNKLTEIGVKKIRKIGNSSEFEQIKNYVVGDDYRHINWKATARKGDLMLNNYIDEKSQHIYCIIDKSRNMQSPFEGLSLLDYAINATLALSNIALLKEDKAGIISMAEKEGALVLSDRKPAHITKILEVLYKEKTRYLELNSEQLYITIRKKIKQRSLLVFFTNFESLSAMRRQLPYLKKIARFHLLLVVFFENTEITNSLNLETKNTQDVYFKTIAEQFVNEKRQIVKELNQHGITSILTTPQNLTVNSINAYLRLKSSQKL